MTDLQLKRSSEDGIIFREGLSQIRALSPWVLLMLRNHLEPNRDLSLMSPTSQHALTLQMGSTWKS